MNSGIDKRVATHTSHIILEDLSRLPIGTEPTYLAEGMVGLCTGGSAVIELFDYSSRVYCDDMVVILPLQFASLHDRSADFSMRFFKVDRVLFMDIMSGVCRMTPDFYFYMRKHFCFHFTENEVRRYNLWCDSLNFRMEHKKPHTDGKPPSICCAPSSGICMSITGRIHRCTNCIISPIRSRLFSIFSMLIAEYYKTAREVSFYADKLCITPKYLTLIATQVTGRSARQCIADFVIIEMKALLRNANVDIKELVKELGFRNQSALSRYFRRQTGMSPSEYRDSIYLTTASGDQPA